MEPGAIDTRVASVLAKLLGAGLGIGGFVGFVKAGSIVSLAVGLFLCGWFLLIGQMMSAPEQSKKKLGLLQARILSLAVGAFMMYRWLETGRFVNIVVSLVSLVAWFRFMVNNLENEMDKQVHRRMKKD
jgi:uncharacterized membrane protein (UPF0136 family)